MNRNAIRFVVLALALGTGGCSQKVSQTKPAIEEDAIPGQAATAGPHPNEAKWGPDTISRSLEPGSEWKQLTNFLVMVGPGPSGLWVRLPKDAKVRPMGGSAGVYAVLPKGKTVADYNVPKEVHLDVGANIMVMLFKSEDPGGSELEKLDPGKLPPGTSRVIARPWIGMRMVTDESIAYSLEYPGLNLIVNAKLEKPAAKERAIRVIEGIIASLRIDPTAQPVNYFPGAGEEENRPIPARNEVAMPDGMKIRATTSVGVIEIEAGPGCKRSYTWEGATRSVIMDPRGERWYGSLGLYYPGPGEHWAEHNGITRGVVEEGQQHFKTADEAVKWVKQRSYMPFVYRNDGLAVGWSKVPERRQLSVEVWQLMINGKRPVRLPGAIDSAIVTTRFGR